MADTIEVEATPIEDGLAKISKADKWLVSARERVARTAAEYPGPGELATKKDYDGARSSRTVIRKDAAAIDAERKAMLRDFEDALADFKGQVKDVLAPLTELDEQYKKALDAYDEHLKVEREIELAQEYQELAPILADVVPFALVMQRFGNEKGKVWLNKSTNIVAAKQMVADAIDTIAEEEAVVAGAVAPEEVEDAKTRYSQTLDLQGTLTALRREREQRERVRRMEEERRAMEQAWEAPVANTQPAVDPNPQPVVETSQPMTDVPHGWVIVASCATKQKMLELRDYAHARGIPFDAIYSGTLQQVYERVVGNAG